MTYIKGLYRTRPSFFYQLCRLEPIKSEIIDYLNRKVTKIEYEITEEELFQHEEKKFNEQVNTVVSKDAGKIFHCLNMGTTMFRLIIMWDRLLAILGHDYLRKQGFYDEDRAKKREGHPVIIDYGTSDAFIKNVAVIDRDALYTDYNFGEPKNPIVVRDYANESLFVKSIIKRAISRYFYKDLNSVGTYPKIIGDQEPETQLSLIHFLTSTSSLLDVLANQIDFIYGVEVSKKYVQKTIVYKKGEIPKDRDGSELNVNWARIKIIADEVEVKGRNAKYLGECLKKWDSKISSIELQKGRNILAHKGNLDVVFHHTKKNESGVFITFETSADKMSINDENMEFYKDASVYCTECFSIILKLLHEYYYHLFQSFLEGETIFGKQVEVEIQES